MTTDCVILILFDQILFCLQQSITVVTVLFLFYHISLLLDFMIEIDSIFFFFIPNRLVPKELNNSVAEMEFRILHSVFCDMFKIQRTAFAFDEYVEIVFEKFVLSIIQIRIVSWVLFLLLLLLTISHYHGFKSSGRYGCEDEDQHCLRYHAAVVLNYFGKYISLF